MIHALLIAWLGLQAPDIVLADFEGDTYGPWKVEGEAFGKGPARGTLPGQQQVGGFLGEGLVNTYLGGDGPQGKLTSPEFKIERGRINFLIGGGRHPGETCINLLVDGKVARTATGANHEFLRWSGWELSEFKGRAARIEIVDRHAGGWGHINVDQIVQSDAEPRIVDDRDGALAKAEASVKAAAQRAAKDPARPVYHFLAPGNWMNDPNGPIQYKGVYHMFYQHNPYGDEWNHMHWGHAVSRDLVTWEHKPIALWPSKARGEDHCFSGCAAVDISGRLVLLYTSIGPRAPEQWIAVSEDPEGLRWVKTNANPVLTLAHHGDVRIDDWRDPFVFREGAKWYMVVGGHRAGGKGCICLYESNDLVGWTFLGIPFEGEEKNWECPNLFRLGEKWVLIYSPHGLVRYYTGTLDLGARKFVPEVHATLDHGENYYAPNGLEDDKGRRIVWGWVKDFPKGRGWNGCLSLPRVLSVGSDGRLRQEPAPELTKLRGERVAAADLVLASATRVLPGIKGNTLEIAAEFDPGDAKAFGIKVGGATVLVRGNEAEAAGTKFPFERRGATVKLRLFVDRSVLEAYLDGRECVTRVIVTPPADGIVEVFADGGTATVKSLEAWPLASIW
jgi:sucrose-6-phosphate hydrolase SacC (GH32 family)